MRYDPGDHCPTWARATGVLVLWAAIVLGLVLMGNRGVTASRDPALLADPWRPLNPGAPVVLPESGPHEREEWHSS